MSEILLEFLKETRIINRQAKLLIEDKNSLSSSDKEMLNKIILNTSKSLSKLGSEINLWLVYVAEIVIAVLWKKKRCVMDVPCVMFLFVNVVKKESVEWLFVLINSVLLP